MANKIMIVFGALLVGHIATAFFVPINATAVLTALQNFRNTFNQTLTSLHNTTATNGTRATCHNLLNHVNLLATGRLPLTPFNLGNLGNLLSQAQANVTSTSPLAGTLFDQLRNNLSGFSNLFGRLPLFQLAWK